MKIRTVRTSIKGDGGNHYTGTMMLNDGEKWIPTMVATHGSTRAGYVDAYNEDTGYFSLWFTDVVQDTIMISTIGLAFAPE